MGVFRFDAKIVASLALLAVVAGVLVAMSMPMGEFAGKSREMQAAAAEQAITTAMLQCYALEGSYPPNLEYLEENYGVLLDRAVFYYAYDVFASNVRPEISVTPKIPKGTRQR